VTSRGGGKPDGGRFGASAADRPSVRRLTGGSVRWRASATTAIAQAPAAAPYVLVAMMAVWAAHDGGYDADTWYWGALVILGLLAAQLVVTPAPRAVTLTCASRWALLALTLYVAWSYASIAWAASPGDALTGSNRALLYLLIFAFFALARWTWRRALMVLVVFALAIGAVGLLVLTRMATGHAASIFSEGRLTSPTGYFNATAALFTGAALMAVALAARRELPEVLRGALLAVACADLQLALLAQSRGWLFTLPVVLVAAVVVIPDRLRVAMWALLAIAATLAVLPAELTVYHAGGRRTAAPLVHAASASARTGLLVCAALLVTGAVLAVLEARTRRRALGPMARRATGAVAVVAAVAAAGAGAQAATHGHPFRLVSRQWHGLTHPTTRAARGSHFATVGSDRYDFWRVALRAALAHPVGGLGQDNFRNYYVKRRQSREEPEWTHSLPMRLLAHTGFVGLILFAAFVLAALAGALKGLRAADPPARAVAGAALLPMVVWLVHGSVDWFWEFPALSGPALGFLGMASALSRRPEESPTAASRPAERRALPGRLAAPRAAITIAGSIALLGGVAVLAFPYLSVRETSTANDIRARDPLQALGELDSAANLNPLSADPGRIGGTIALQTGRYLEAERRFGQAINRDPGGWFSWFGDGLAASALGDRARARRDYEVAESINSRQPPVRGALARVDSFHPMTPRQALRTLVFAH